MDFIEAIKNKKIIVGIVGLGYVGLPLALEYASKEVPVLGFDIDESKIPLLMEGKSYIKHISSDRIEKAVRSGYFNATSDFSRLPEVDAIIICVPTPLTEHREPDMTYIVDTTNKIAEYLRKGQIVTLESTTYPGTTDELMLPILEQAPVIQQKILKENKIDSSNHGNDLNNHSAVSIKNLPFKVGVDFYLAFSPEREDPNNKDFTTATIPKVVGGVTEKCLEVAVALYDLVIEKTVPVSSARAAESTKLLENIFRSVNIALVNELKMVFDKMEIDIWEVIQAASTKPFGFKPFYPGPGLGGHCIPIDPFYLTWKAREYEMNTKFIELAGEINTFQPHYVVTRMLEICNEHKMTLNGAKVLVLGAAYKKDIDDMRESPTLKLIEVLREKGSEVYYNDPFIPALPKTRKYDYKMDSVELTKENLAEFDVVLLSTDHSDYDYKFISENSKLIIDTRNAFGSRGIVESKIYKA